MEMAEAGLLSTVGVTAVNAARGFLREIAGPAAQELGQAFGETARFWRLRNQVRLLNRAREMVGTAGIDPKSIPLRVLFPLLEGASIEDDHELSERWAALLANAAAHDGDEKVLPSFPTLLRQISPVDARALDHLFSVHDRISSGEIAPEEFNVGTDRADRLVPWGIEPAELHRVLGLQSSDAVGVSLDNLVGLGLVEREPLMRMSEQHVLVPTIPGGVRLSQLGVRFIRACQPPRAIESHPLSMEDSGVG
jgi:hypothetical protein